MTAVAPPKQSRRISIPRLLSVLALAAVVIFLGYQWTVTKVEDLNTAESTTWFAPHVDTTLVPLLHFEDPNEQPAADVVLAFVVADPVDVCKPSWGSYYNMDAAGRALDLDRRIVRLREGGGDVIVSFGGAANAELATVCEDMDSLVAAYQAVVDRYALFVLDFDIEGTTLENRDANERRNEAIVALQSNNADLEVWFTLPVAPSGLTAEGIALIDHALAAGVDLAGVNVMAMNYSGSRLPGQSMIEGSVVALLSTWQQLDGAFRRAGRPQTEQRIWSLIGVTPMIGQNDVANDSFTTEDARSLAEFVESVNLGRISMWSANRDAPCGAAVDDQRVSNTCSGTDQNSLEFSRILASGAQRRAPDGAEASQETEGRTGEEARAENAIRNDPRISPYPLWRSAKVYVEGAKIVWQGRVYQAKWWTQGDQPDAPVKQIWDTPWRYLGPVLDSDRAAVLEDEPVEGGPRQRWAGERVYVAGDEVDHGGNVFLAKWWTQGDVPQEDPDQPYDHPWQYLGPAELDD